MSSADKTILLTGGAGFIGSHVTERLVHRGYRVVNLDLLTYAGNVDNLSGVARNSAHRLVQGDICDRSLVARLLRDFRPYGLFNIAAETHVDRSIDDANRFIETNVTGVYCLLDEALAHWRGLEQPEKNAFRFIQMSTDEVYGSIANGVFVEESNYAPNSPYAASKAAGDHMARAFGITFGLPVILIHASNTYGPRQHPEKLIPHMIISALSGKPLPVYGQGQNIRDWMYVDDLARGLEDVVSRGQAGEIYNFAGRDERNNIDTVKLLCGRLDKAAPRKGLHEAAITFVPDRPGHDFRYAMSIDKVRRVFGWSPEVGFDQGLSATVSWYLNNRDWWQAVLDRGYSAQRIGLGE